MTEDSAIRIGLHSAEVVHFHHTKKVTIGTLITTFHYVHANNDILLQLGGYPPALFDPHLRHQTAMAGDLTCATGSNLIHTVYAPFS